jgi:hypothetical protein
LTSVTIGGAVANIGDYAFEFCASLASIYFLGNAPNVDNTAIPSGILAYYLPGSTGWGGFGADAGVSVVPWNPLIQTGNGGFGVQNGHFGFHITGPANSGVVVTACTNLASPVWSPLQTITLTNGAADFSDSQSVIHGSRFYTLQMP